MVGFKFIWPLLSLLLFAACVPQTKQTSCGANEAFSPSLRSCVPIVNGPSSFIQIDSFLPTSTLTKYKNDTNPVTLSVTITNPYAQTYNVEWERSYNGVVSPITPDSPTSFTFAPLLYSTQVGTHNFTVKVKDIANVIVSSHNFQIVINENPKPVIDTSTIFPAAYNSSLTPINSAVIFRFTVKNNGSAPVAGYRTDWSVDYGGTQFYTESDTHGNLTAAGTNLPSYTFNPAALTASQGVGVYTIRAKVIYNGGEIVAEQQWSVTLSHPLLSKINNRDIYSSTSNPTFNTLTEAFNGVPYTTSPLFNFKPCTMSGGVCVDIPGATAQGNYCVSVVSGEGTYPGDNKFVRVDYLLDGGSIVYTAFTAASDNQVCLTDGGAGVLSAVLFNNTSPTTSQAHTLVARVTDVATGTEYKASDMNPSLGTYPITWNFLVQPQNEAPKVAFGTLTGLTCSAAVGTARGNCSVTSDTNFTVKINFLTDDFYTLPGNEAALNYSIRLYKSGVNIQTCTKSDPGYSGATDVNGADGYECVFNIESYNGAGPLLLNPLDYTIQAEVSDTGSPITGVAATSSTLTWTFGTLTEKNTAPSIAGFTVSNAVNEGAAINFAANVTDLERDNSTYAIKYCPDVACATPTTLTTGTMTRTTNVNPYALSVNYTLPEDFLYNIPALGCKTKKRNETCSISFLLTVTDIPDSVAPLTGTTAAIPSTITNINPIVVLNTAFSSPSPAVFNPTNAAVLVGFPLSFVNNPASITTDASAVASEKVLRYQWFIKNNTSVTTYTAIPEAKFPNLVWTPSLIKEANLLSDNPLSIILCVEDQPLEAVPTILVDLLNCNTATPWTVITKNNVQTLHDLSAAPSSTELATGASDTGKEMAIWYDQPSTFNLKTTSATYVAMFGNDGRIHVKKALVMDRDGINPINPTLIASFTPLPPAGLSPSGTAQEIKDLSITGTGNELYISYLASFPGAPAGSFYPQVRRIDLTIGKLAANNHAGKFGFDYTGLGFTNGCVPAGDCPLTQASGVTTISFAPSGGAITGNFLLNSRDGDATGNFTVNFGTYNLTTSTICSTCTGATMATQLAELINRSTDPILAGYSASAAGSTVTISGARSSDFFESSTDVNARLADRLGKIYVSGGSWYLPFIDTSLGGLHNDKLSVFSAPVGDVMANSTEILLQPSSSTGLATMEAAIKFDNYLVGTNLWIAMVTKTGSAGKLYRVDPNSFALNDTDDLFATEALLDLQVSASTTRVFVSAETAANKLKLGIYDNNGLKDEEFEINDTFHFESGTDTDKIFNKASMSSFKIIPYGSEARVFAISAGTPISTSSLYVARLSEISSNWTLSCGKCVKASELGQDLSSRVNLAVAPIRNKPSALLYRLSSEGSPAVTNQGVKEVAYVSFGRKDTASATTCDPAMGVFNIEAEAIGSDSIFTGGIAPNQDAGLYRTPFIKN